MIEARRDDQTVTPAGERLRVAIDGVVLRVAVTHVDDRGSLVEIFNPDWGLDDEALRYVYQSTIRPGKIKGWIVHHIQTDRLLVTFGTCRIVLFDGRDGSPTRHRLEELFVGEQNRTLVTIPPGVWHAVQNVSDREAVFINSPSRAYDHEQPDKYPCAQARTVFGEELYPDVVDGLENEDGVPPPGSSGHRRRSRTSRRPPGWLPSARVRWRRCAARPWCGLGCSTGTG